MYGYLDIKIMIDGLHYRKKVWFGHYIALIVSRKELTAAYCYGHLLEGFRILKIEIIKVLGIIYE